MKYKVIENFYFNKEKRTVTHGEIIELNQTEYETVKEKVIPLEYKTKVIIPGKGW